MLFQNSVNTLQNRSSSIIGIFTKTVNDLEKVNKQCDKEALKRNTKAAQLQAEEASLRNTVASNTRVINKINSILND